MRCVGWLNIRAVCKTIVITVDDNNTSVFGIRSGNGTVIVGKFQMPVNLLFSAVKTVYKDTIEACFCHTEVTRFLSMAVGYCHGRRIREETLHVAAMPN